MEQVTGIDRQATEHERTMRFLLSWPVAAFDNRLAAGDTSTTSQRRGQVLASLCLVTS